MKKIQKQAIKHYDEMIKYVEKQKPNQFPDCCQMEDAIEMDWYVEYCPYCEKYLIKEESCERCPLTAELAEYQDGSSNCCKNLWDRMSYARSWKTWLKYARLIRQYIINNG